MNLRLTLTARLTLLYSVVSMAVLCGLGALVTLANQAHFVDLDRDYLADKAALRHHDIAALERIDHVAVFLGALLLRADKQKVEYANHQHEHRDGRGENCLHVH